MNKQRELIDSEVKRLMTEPSTNSWLADLPTHVRFMNYTSKEVSRENVFRLSKIQWLAAGCPIEPIELEVD